MNKQNRKLQAQKKIVSCFKKRGFKLRSKELSLLLDDIERFVTTLQRIYIYPQARYNIRPSEDDPKIKNLVKTVQKDELNKILKDNKKMPLDEAFRKLNEGIETGNKK